MCRYFAAVAFLIGCATATAFGCSCYAPIAERPCSLMKEASEVVFAGTLIAVDNPPGPAGSRRVADQVGQAHYTFRVEKAFSKSVPKQIDIYSGRGGGDCSVRFRVGEKYLVDATRESTGEVRVWRCSKTRLFSESDPLLAEFRVLRDGKAPDSLFGVLTRMPGPWGDAVEHSDPAVGGLTIRLRSEDREFETKTAQDGSYTFRDLPSGNYSVSADIPHSLTLGDARFHRPIKPFPVAGNACGEFDIAVFPAGRIIGRVVDQGGQQISTWVQDAQLLRVDGPNRYREIANESGTMSLLGLPPYQKGYFEFDYVAPGDYIVVLNPYNLPYNAHPYPRTFFPSATEPEQATRIHMHDGDTVSDIVIYVAVKPPNRPEPGK
jgi:hypothetical protein